MQTVEKIKLMDELFLMSMEEIADRILLAEHRCDSYWDLGQDMSDELRELPTFKLGEDSWVLRGDMLALLGQFEW